jgi:hypothetical protein
METITTPNWLSIVGSCYLIFAFGFLAGSAGLVRGWGATPEVRHQVTDYGRRILVFAAGMMGCIGMLFQLLGQFVMVEHGLWFVLACLALVPVVLAYVFLGDVKLESYRRLIEGARLTADASDPQGSDARGSTLTLTQLASVVPAAARPVRNAAE